MQPSKYSRPQTALCKTRSMPFHFAAAAPLVVAT
jgi:hypothetical protein